MKRAFTLAEIMIVLAVIGVLSAILIPIARNSMPDENIMKFKKAHNTLLSAIRELVTSDKYYLDGDLGLRPNGELIDGSHENDEPYFCNTMTEILNSKANNCNQKITSTGGHCAVFTKNIPINFDVEENLEVSKQIMQKAKEYLDTECKSDLGRMHGAQIILPDNVVMYETYNKCPFGVFSNDKRVFASDNTALNHDINGFGVGYKIFCIDIDGYKGETKGSDEITSGDDWLFSTSKCDDTDDICPFGYGIRADGKILIGKRATEWLEKSEQNND